MNQKFKVLLPNKRETDAVQIKTVYILYSYIHTKVQKVLHVREACAEEHGKT